MSGLGKPRWTRSFIPIKSTTYNVFCAGGRRRFRRGRVCAETRRGGRGIFAPAGRHFADAWLMFHGKHFVAGRKIGRMTRAIRPVLGAGRRYGRLRPPFDVGERYTAHDHLRFFVPVVPDAEVPPTPPWGSGRNRQIKTKSGDVSRETSPPVRVVACAVTPPRGAPQTTSASA